jgi:hypothetical protein
MADTKQTYQLTGRVVDVANGNGLTGVRVEAWDRAGIVQDVVALSLTDALGDFALTLSRAHVDELFFGRPPVLELRAFSSAGKQLHGPEVRWRASVRPATVRVEVSTAKFGPRNQGLFVVQGLVTDAAGTPIQATVTVQAFDKNIDGLTLLNTPAAAADAEGRYRITYDLDDLGRAGKKAADLIVKASWTVGQSTLTVESDVLCQAPPAAKVDLVAGGVPYRGPSEWSTVHGKVAEIAETVPLKDLTEDQVEYVSCSGRVSRTIADAVVAAAKLDDQSTRVSEEVFYGLIRQGLPSTKVALHRHRPAAMRRALEAAIDANLIGDLTATLDDIIDDLVEDGVELAAVAQPPDDYALGGANGLLAIALSNDNDRKSFIRQYIKHEGTVPEFWASLSSPLNGDVVKRTVQLGILTRNYLPMVQALHALFGTTFTTFADLAKYKESDWLTLVQATGYPSDIPPNDPPVQATQEANYAHVLARTVEAILPTRSLCERIRDVEPSVDIVKFFDNNPTFDFASARVGAYIAATPGWSSGFSGDPALTRTRLEKTERLFKLTRRWPEMKVLYDDGLHSARQVKAMGKARFVGAYADALNSPELAGSIWDKAAYVSDAANALFAKYHSSQHSLRIYALPDLATESETPPDEVADWGTIFGGSVSYCACEHCRSVLGPAAYLVDLLQFLGRHDSTVETAPSSGDFYTAKEILIGSDPANPTRVGRRPDLRRLELSCDNTNTVLPFVDLVDEIMEMSVAQIAGPGPYDWPDPIVTTGETPDLLATPEVLDPAVHDHAYEVLSGAVHPFTLPFNLWSDEIHTYLGHLGVPQQRLLEVLRKGTPGEPALYGEREAAMRLRLSKRDWEVLTASDVAAVASDWGMTGGSWVTDLGHIARQASGTPGFLEQAGLTFDELRELLATAYAGGDVTLDTSGNCDLAQRTLTGLDAALLGRLQRFLRLRLRTGLRITELDKAMLAFGVTDVSAAFLQKLALALQLRDELKLPLLEILSWWGDLDTRWTAAADLDKAKEWGASLYAQLFINRSVLNPPDPDFENPGTLPSGTLADHPVPLLAALRIGAADFALLTDSGAAQARVFLDAPLDAASVTVATLSRAYRLVSFARAMGLSLPELLVLKTLANVNALTGDDTATAAVPADTQKLIDIVRQVRGAGFRVAEVDFLLRRFVHETDPVGPPAGTEEQLAGDLAAGIDEILNDTAIETTGTPPVSTEPAGARTRALLGELVSGATPTDQRANVEAVMRVLEAQDLPADPGNIITTLLGPLVPSISDAIDKLKPGEPGYLTEVEQRFTYVLLRLLDDVRKIRGDGQSKKLVAAATGLDDDAAAQILIALFDGVTLLRPPSLVGSWTAGGAGDRLTIATRVLMMGVLVRGFGMRTAELQWLYPAPGGSWFDPNGLPITTVDMSNSGLATAARARFVAWRQLADFYAVRASLRAGPQALVEVLQEGPNGKPALLDALAGRSGWSRDDLDDLDGSNGFSFTFPSEYTGVGISALVRLRDAFALLQRLGASAGQALSWAPVWDAPLPPPAPGSVAAAEIKRVVRAKYDDARWREVARPLRDVAREKQRAALVTWLVANHPDAGVDTPNDLYAKLLVDVEMSPCQLTSRVKLAIGSVQQFVQRCLLNLEDTVKLGDEAANEWRWLKSYRVWEANRKVFLWPENWIEPELRPDKTPFFEALEGQLLQNEITAESAEDAYRQYLAKLDEVARLDARAIFHQVESDGPGGDVDVDVLHVIARSPQPPYLYYYRRRIDGAVWTPWEKVDLEIEGEHLVAVVHNRRLYLFWARMMEVPDAGEEQEGGTEDGPLVPPKTHLEVQLGWSFYRNGRWSQKRSTSGDPLLVRPASGSANLPGLLPVGREQVWLSTAEQEDGSLQIRCAVNIPTPSDSVGFSLGIPSRDITVGTFALLPCTETQASGQQFEDNFVWSGAAGTWSPANEIEVAAPALTQRENMDFAGSMLLALPLAELYGLPQEVVLGGGMIWPYRLTVEYDGVRIENQHERAVLKDAKRSFVMTLQTTLPNWADPTEGQPCGETDAGLLGLTSDLQLWVDSSCGSLTVPIADVGHRYRFETFYHPYVCDFSQQLERYGLDGLLRWEEQTSPPLQLRSRQIDSEYNPQAETVEAPFPSEDVDFAITGAYAQYNWELFFHAPLLVAKRLHDNQRFAEARDWLHYIFDPTGAAKDFDADAEVDPAPQRFWRVRPFFENEDLESIQEQLTALAGASSTVAEVHALFANDGGVAAAAAITAQIERWRRDPFSPHVIARMRPIAYQKMVVRFYIENLLAWGDQLFRRDTVESINEATQLYVMAADLLGPKPQLVKEPAEVVNKTYAELEQDLDAFSNAIIAAENLVLPPGDTAAAGTGAGGGAESVPTLASLYFCVPPNEKMLGLWDLVADRLFKIRHCMNIEGVVRQLPLFEPPIEPGLLVRAAAAGVDIGSVLSETNAAAPIYRFAVLLPKALELCGTVMGLGGALLSALEKRDAEALGRLRQTHEVGLLDAVRDVRKRQVDEAKESLAALERSKLVTQERYEFYLNIPERTPAENAHERLSRTAMNQASAADAAQSLAAVLAYIPQFTAGISGLAATPVAHAGFGGQQLSTATSVVASVMRGLASRSSAQAGLASLQATYDRRWKEWKLQENLARKELAQIDKQLEAARLRLEIAENELANHDRQRENAREVEDYLRHKYTNTELYDWTAAQVAAIHFQAYSLAYDMAKRAEHAFQLERAERDATYIVFGYWDSLKKGLLAGERLALDLRRMEAAYLDSNRRELEITKHVSLAELDPRELFKLRENGTCTISIPESELDQDYPGHYLRRIKNVSMTVPCVTGPYDGVNCHLQQTKSTVRVNSSLGSGYTDSSHLQTNFGLVEKIATSTAQADAGLFTVDFRDERFLPFEGGGVVSDWTLRLKAADNRFDVQTLNDVVLHLRYTARDGGEALRTAASGAAPTNDPEVWRLFSLKGDFPDEWGRFVEPPGATQTASLALVDTQFRRILGSRKVKITAIEVFLRWNDKYTPATPLSVTLNPPSSSEVSLATGSLYGAVLNAAWPTFTAFNVGTEEAPTTLVFTAPKTGGANSLRIDGTSATFLKTDAVQDVWFALKTKKQ